eukprot:CAMPEP_0206217448 /NCGR_PEP_ID=MMETSP0047_2-20121206/3281_1 /ASSEMBLY_ACC=CAM_ASM_000192 /TAXON_ID=195065 /ORGANISM="Chroomonas mesostigmatica_cf, Strain CCMP1168" /LENGTH=56 /DNA_ID=CAMNT_0053639905 /DNA_START=179 /DNA_END=346 /DNA_ORIENTATION=+
MSICFVLVGGFLGASSRIPAPRYTCLNLILGAMSLSILTRELALSSSAHEDSVIDV